MKQNLLRSVTCLMLLLLCHYSYGQAALQSGLTISQDFNGLGQEAIASLPPNWSVSKSTSARDVNYAAAILETERLGGNNLASNAANGIYNFGAGVAAEAIDRAVGFVSSGTSTKSGNLFFTGSNNSTETIKSLAIAYQVEKYRDGFNPSGYTIELFFSKDGATWTSAGEDFKTSFPADLATVGYESAPGLTIPVAGNLQVNVSPNESLFLAWNYSVTSGSTTTSSQALAIDDVSITPQGEGDEILQVSTPSFSPFPGRFDEAQSIALETTTEGASIHYSLDGTDPDAGSLLYTAPFEISETVTIKAIGIKEGFNSSPIIEGEFLIDIPVFVPANLPYKQEFADFVNLSPPVNTFGMTNEWTLDGPVLLYGGNFASGTSGGFRGNNVLGYQHTGSTGTINATLTLRNNTSAPINELEVSYEGKVARVNEGRSPEWTVTLNGNVIPELAYSTINGIDEQVSYIITGLAILPGEVFEINWSSQRGGGGGASRQIGIANLEVKATEIPDTPVTFLETFDKSNTTTSYANGSFVGDNDITWEYVSARNEGDFPIDGKGILLRNLSTGSRIFSQSVPGGIRSFSVDMRKAFTGNAARQIALYINGVEIARSESFASDGADATIRNFEVNNLEIEGDVVIEIRNLTTGQIVIDNISWTTLQSFSGPIVEALSPANRADKVALDADLQIKFNGTINKGEGTIEIYKEDGTQVQSIDVNSAEVSITGDLVEIKANAFETFTKYYVLIGSGAFVDEVGQPFIGFSSPIEWAFETLDPFNVTEDFNNSCPDGIPLGWEAISLIGDQVWECTTFGRAGTSPTASAPFGLQISGFSGGAQLNEDWLITPSYDLTAFDFPLLSFWSRGAFTGPRLKLLVSTDYVGGNPSDATWTELSDRFDNANVWTFSEQINLEEFKASNVRLAFVYTSNPEEGAARWTLDDFALVNSQEGPAPFLSNSIGNLDYFHFGIVPSGTVADKTESFNFSLSDGIEGLTVSGPEGFEFSKNGTEFSSELVYTAKEAAANNRVSIRFKPTGEGAFSGTIRIESGDISISKGFLTGATVERNKSFDVVTWNVEWFGSTNSGQGPTNVDLQLQNVKTIIEDLDADVYAFQEITNLDKFNELVLALEGYEASVSPAASLGADQYDNAQKLIFLYKTATVEPITTRVLLEGVQASDLVDYPAPVDRFWASGRLPYLMEVKTNINGVEQRINLINVHTRSNGGGESAGNPRYAMRKYDVNVLKDSLDLYYSDVALILVGDYNDDLDETVADQTAPTVNTTETSFIEYINDRANYRAATISLSNAGLRTFITFENVIDHMIISDELFDNWEVNSERVVVPFDLVTNYQNTTSDHLPVKVRFTFKCDLEAGQVIGTPEVCGIGNEAELMLIGGVYDTILGWEVSTDGGQNWKMLPDTENRSEVSVNDISKTSLFRVILDSDICQPIVTESHEIVVSQLPEPVIYFERGQLVTITGNYTYEWYKDGQLINTSQLNSTRINGAGQYQVVITDEKGCQASSAQFRFPQQLPASKVKVFPNPASTRVTVAINKGEGMINVELMNRTGFKIAGQLTSEGLVEFDVSSLVKGVYLIVITDNMGQRVVERLLIE